MKRILPNRRHDQFEVTDDRITSRGGFAFSEGDGGSVGRVQDAGFVSAVQEATARRFRYREPVVVDRFSVLRRWIASGSGSSVDRQRQSGIAGFEEHGGQSKDRRGDCVSTRRCKANARHADSLRGLTTQIAKLVAPSIIRREVKRRGYVPIFLDGTAIEVKGKNFEGPGRSIRATKRSGCTPRSSASSKFRRV